MLGVAPRTRRSALAPRLRGALESLGVTRLARVTGLDRAGVEVACAVRPLGHVLQVSNGKGSTFAEAARGALLEAAELAAAEAPGRAFLRWGSAAELAKSGARLFSPGDLGAEGPLSLARMAWVPGRDLPAGRERWVPASAVFCPPADGPFLGPAAVPWTSNGMGACFSRAPALLHALLEAAERDRLARALPEGFTSGRIARTLLRPATVARVAPRTARLARGLSARGFEVFLFDLSARGEIPVAAALLGDGREGPVPLTAGYAAGLDPDRALRSAVLEAAQSRLTDIHGAREDVRPPERSEAEELLRLCRGARPSRDASAMPRLARPARALGSLVRILGRGGREIAVVDLPCPSPGIHVVKVVAPGLRRSELL